MLDLHFFCFQHLVFIQKNNSNSQKKQSPSQLGLNSVSVWDILCKTQTPKDLSPFYHIFGATKNSPRNQSKQEIDLQFDYGERRGAQKEVAQFSFLKHKKTQNFHYFSHIQPSGYRNSAILKILPGAFENWRSRSSRTRHRQQRWSRRGEEAWDGT